MKSKEEINQIISSLIKKTRDKNISDEEMVKLITNEFNIQENEQANLRALKPTSNKRGGSSSETLSDKILDGMIEGYNADILFVPDLKQTLKEVVDEVYDKCKLQEDGLIAPYEVIDILKSKFGERLME